MSFATRSKKLTDTIYSPRDATSEAAIRGQVDGSIQEVYDNVQTEVNLLDGANVKLTGNQTVAGVKTFSSSPIIPVATADTQPVQKLAIDAKNATQDTAIGLRALDTAVVHKTGNETIDDVKTFTSSPIVPVATTNTQAPQKLYVDTLDGANVKKTGDQTVAGVKTFTSVVKGVTPVASVDLTTKGYTDDLVASQTPLNIPDGSLTEAKMAPEMKKQSGGVYPYDLGLIPKKLGGGLLINGNFDVWQKATSQTTSGYGSDDRWRNLNSGSTKVHSQESFTIGQLDVPNNPEFYSRTVVTSVAGTGNFVIKNQKIENVSNLSGQKATLSFWAKADSVKNIAVEFTQDFGSGGSGDIDSIGSQLVELSVVWEKHTVTVDIPSISGKTIGSGNALQIFIWMDAGTSFNARTASLGQQSGTFDISEVKIEVGEVATDFIPKTYAEELRDCQRYFERIEHNQNNGGYGAGVILNATTARFYIQYDKKRVNPTISISAASDFEAFYSNASATITALTSDTTNVRSTTLTMSAVGMTVASGAILRAANANSYIDVDAEL